MTLGAATVRCVAVVMTIPLVLPAAAATEDAPTKTTITMRNTVGLDPVTRILVLRANGAAPTETTRLVDDTGRHRIVATPLPATDPQCSQAPVHDTGSGADTWCFRLEHVTTGTTYKGDLSGAAAVVSLTVTARHGATLPVLAAAAALVLAVLLAWLTTRSVPELVTRMLLWRALCRDDGVDGLRTWGRDAAGVRLSRADVLARVRWAKGPGIRQLRATRAQLRMSLASGALPDCPLRQAAETAAARTDVARPDLLTDAGTRATSDAERLLTVVSAASDAIKSFDGLAQALLDEIPHDDANRVAAEKLVAQQRELPTDFLSEFTLELVQQSFLDSLETLRGYADVTPPTASAQALVAAIGPGRMVAAARGWVEQSKSAVEGSIRLATAAGAVIVTAAILMTIATATVFAAQYLPNETFGTARDYFLLVVTALGSSAAAGILAVLVLLRGPTAWYG
ncbi:MAG TPA: hypothetical protein VIB48_11545 [Acidimicrobiia bacterium]|jgi:hypothetical protein